MREELLKLVGIIVKNYKIEEPILEIGSMLSDVTLTHIEMDKGTGKFKEVDRKVSEYGNLRLLFKDKRYFGIDSRSGPGVDMVMDAQRMELKSNIMGTVLCLDTIEHVENPFKLISEIHRVLRPGGLLILSTVFCFPIHNYPSDYWRITPDGMRLLLNDFHDVVVSYSGHTIMPYGIEAIAKKHEFKPV